jgi:hypothetical protein
MDPVYLIWPMTDHPAIPDKDWQKTQRQKYQTAECGHWNMPADSHAVLSDLGSTATDLNFTEIPPLELMSRSLAECLLLADELALSLNPTFVGDGTETMWMSYHAAVKAQVRGDKKSYGFRCKQCDRLFYTPMGAWYLLRTSIPDLNVFGTTSGGICVREFVAMRLLQRRWPKVSIKPIPVRDSPVDGFPIDLNELTPEQERRVVGSRF